MALLSTTTGDASTLRLYTPGGSPCDGVCSYDWAVEEFNVPRGEPVRMMAPAGSIVMKMSYGRDGQPYAMSDSAILASDQYGEGYWFEEDGRQKLMFRLDECQNWSVLEPPLLPALTYHPPAPPETFPTPVDWFLNTPCCLITLPPTVIPPIITLPTVTQPIIPIAPALPLLITALGMLFFLRR